MLRILGGFLILMGGWFAVPSAIGVMKGELQLEGAVFSIGIGLFLMLAGFYCLGRDGDIE